MCLNSIGNAYYFLADYNKALHFYKRAKHTYATFQDKSEAAADLKMFIYLNIGQGYNELNQLDSAFFYLKESYQLTLHSQFWHPVLLYNFGDCQFKRGKLKYSPKTGQVH